MEDIKDIIARNLVNLRMQAGLTQLQLAEKLNYSDKAVSKWERGESIPDLRVLVQIADLYNVTLDQLVGRKKEEKPLKPKMNIGKKRMLITTLSVVLVWFVCSCVYMVLGFIPAVENYKCFAFIGAPLASCIVLCVFAALWGNRWMKAASTSGIVWSAILLAHFLLSAFGIVDKMYLFYIAAGVFQVLIILWFVLRKVK